VRVVEHGPAPSRFRATCCPIFIALSKCSTRIGPNTGWSCRATSPIAQTPFDRRSERGVHGDPVVDGDVVAGDVR
jgi:hypothetical protein